MSTNIAAPCLLVVAVLIPGHMFGWALEWAWVMATAGIATLAILRSGRGGELIGVDVKTITLLMAGLIAISCLAYASTIARGEYVTFRDMAEMARWPVYLLFMLLIAALVPRWSVRGVDRVLRFIVWFILACSAIYLLEVPPFYQVLSSTLYADAKVLVGIGYIRIPFPFENPNFLAYFLLLVLAHFAFFARNLLYVAMCVVLLFLTGSRSGWIAAGILLVAFAIGEVLPGGAEHRAKSRFAALSLIAVGSAAATVYWEQLTAFSRFSELLESVQTGDFGEVNTAQIRLDAFQRLLIVYQESPLWGWGPGRGMEIDVADNQFLSWLLAWGVVGTALLAALGAATFTASLCAARRRAHVVGTWAIALSIGAMLFTGDFLENYRLFFITLVMLQTNYVVSRSTIKPSQLPIGLTPLETYLPRHEMREMLGRQATQSSRHLRE